MRSTLCPSCHRVYCGRPTLNKSIHQHDLRMASPVYAITALTVLITAGFVWAVDETYDFSDYRDHPCIRACEDNSLPRTCKYTFVLETYYVLSKACHQCPFNQSHCFLPHCVPADGVSRGIKTANRMLPGPGIQVCEGDTIEVKVHNVMESGEGTSIHWHGILQKGSPHMDGAAMVTQCPIPAHASFTYSFKAQNAGTHFWHSHSGIQRSDGLFGSLVVRRPPSLEPHLQLYDYDLPEHVIVVNDWFNEMTISRFVCHHHDNCNQKPKLTLINGMGVHEKFVDEKNVTHETPRATFTVQGGKKYRFRIISSAIMNCPFQVSIDSHTLTMIASDGDSFEPYVVDSFNIFAGERFDFVLVANKTEELRNYWIRMRGLGDCDFSSTFQTAILKYEGAPDVLPPEPTTWENSNREGKKLNPLNHKGTEELVEITEMVSTDPDDDTMTATPDKKLYLALGFYPINSYRFNNPYFYPMSSVERFQRLFMTQINHITSILPPSPPLTQMDDVSQDLFCNAETVQKHCDREWCTCVHLYKVNLGDLVELVLVDEGADIDSNHPMHIHGYKFRVIGMDKLNDSTTVEEVKALDIEGQLNRTTSRAPLKDTVTVPDGGYTIIRFRANNPGIWFFHCHIEFHVDIGMGLLFQVGSTKDFPPKPKHFPTCGDFHFSGYEEEGGNDSSGSDNSKACPNSSRRQEELSFQALVFVLLCVLLLF